MTYSHSKIPLLIIAVFVALCVCVTGGLMPEETLRGGELARYALLGAIWLQAALFLWLYFRSGVNTYMVTEEGLVVKRLFTQSLHPWNTITRLDWNRPLHYVVIRGESGTIAFTSTGFSPWLPELLSVIHERSGCALPGNMQALLGGREALQKIVVLESEIQAQVLDAILTDRGIPHVMHSYYDRAYDGVFQASSGWGHVEAPGQFRDEIIAILKDMDERGAPPEDSLVEEREPGELPERAW